MCGNTCLVMNVVELEGGARIAEVVGYDVFQSSTALQSDLSYAY